MSNPLDTSSKVSESLGFAFDIIVVRIKLSNVKNPDVSQFRVDVKFNRNDLKITSSRINVDTFKLNSGFEFKERPAVLKERLYKYPLECKVSYKDKTVGNCTFIWPESFINCLSGDCSKELTHCDEGDIIFQKGVVGKLEILARLLIKCDEFQIPDSTKPKVKSCDQPDVQVIDPNDVLFVIGEDKIGSVCNDIEVIPSSETTSSANRTCLDLSDFRHINGKTVTNFDILKSLDAACSKSKKPSNEFQDIIESIAKKAKQMSSECSVNAKKTETKKFPWQQQTKSMDCMSGNRFASCSSSDSYNPCRCVSDENVSVNSCIICLKDESVNKPTKRYCPLCHDNVTWLPKYAACPRCGFKPISYSTEKSYDCNVTADKILQEYNNKKTDNTTTIQSSNTNQVASQSNSECRCTCEDEKICAHCRIRKLCEDIFQTAPKKDEDCGKCESKSSEMYNVCKTSSCDCRPYLAKVFQELKGLYEIKDSKKKYKTLPGQENNTKHTASVNRKQAPQKSSDKPKECKEKIFDSHSQRKYPGTKLGHKTCLNGFAGRKNVPHNMGWLWNVEAKGQRTGWKPGAIRKPIKALMQHFLNKHTPHPCDDLKLNENSKKSEDEEDNYTHEATLRVCKRNGIYYITLRPLKDPETLKECSDPYVNVKPIQFIISKNPLLLEMRKLKQCLKDLGFPKCVCHKPISFCCCRSFLEKKKLEYQCNKECQKLQLPSVTESLVLSDTTDSEDEFEFGVTPPAGVQHPERCLQRNKKKVSSGTQYEVNDWNIKPEYPLPMSKYLKLYNCAVGQRFGKEFGPYGSKGYTAGAVPMEGIYGPCGGKGLGASQAGRNFGSKVGKYGKGMAKSGPGAFLTADGKFSMAQYLAAKAMNKPSPKEIAERKKQKMALLKGVNPPLLCTVDRRGKPVDFCSYNPIPCDPACLRDNRIC